MSKVCHRLVELDLVLSEDSIVLNAWERFPADIDHTRAESGGSNVQRETRWHWRDKTHTHEG